MTTTRLPFALDPLPGEDAPTYLASYAFRLGTTVEALAGALGFTRATGTGHLTKPTPADHPRLSAAVTAATGLDQAAITALLTAPAPDRPLGANAFALALRTDPPVLERAGTSPVDRFVKSAAAELGGPNRLDAHDRLGDLFLIAAHIDAPETGPPLTGRALAAHLTAARLTKALHILTWQHTETPVDPLAGIDPRLTVLRRGPEPIPYSWQLAGPALTRRIARLLGTNPPAVFRLRHATTVPRTRHIPRNPDPAARAARIPDQLWPAWAIRLTEEEGVNNTYFRAHLATAMLLPGARIDLSDLARTHGTDVTGPGISHQLRRLAATPGGEKALTILTELALALDREHVPINYARRRAVFTSTKLIDAATCAKLLKNADLKPGAARRLELIRTYLYEMLTGSSHATAPEPYRIRKGYERNDYLEFTATMPASLVTALTQHSRTLLAARGIDEPLDWQPPTDWARTTDFPGREPDATDPAPIHQTVLARWAATTEHWAPTHQDAATLGISIEHLRYVLRRHPLPHAPYTQLRAGAVIADPDATVPFRAHPGPDTPGRVYYLDPSWLHQQYTTLGRTVADLATQIGCTKATLRNHMAIHEYPMRSRGTGAYLRPDATCTDPADLPALLRAALAGPNGAQRVHRFLVITKHQSLNQAATTLGIPQNALTTQLKALERRCGTPLFHRRPQPAPLGPLTTHGEQLCEQARQHLTPQRLPPDE